MATKKKRVLALALALAMIATLFPLAAFALDPAPTSKVQIQKNEGQDPLYYDGNSQESTNPIVQNNADSPRVTISKTIAGTNTENVFDITLNVNTNQKVTKVASMPDAAVALVIDTSGSMSFCATCGTKDDRLGSPHKSDCPLNPNKVTEAQATQVCKQCKKTIGEKHTKQCSYSGMVLQDQTESQCKDCKKALVHGNHCNNYVDDQVTVEQSRMAMAQKAAIEFAGAFAASGTYTDAEGQTKTARRFISLTTFASTGSGNNQTFGQELWIDVTTLDWKQENGSYLTSDNIFTQKIKQMKANGGTNVAEGLSKADTSLTSLFETQKENENLTRGSSYVLLLGDGEPNEHYAKPDGVDGNFRYTTDNEFSKIPYYRAEQWMKKVNDDGTKIMTAYVGKSEEDIGYKWFDALPFSCVLASNVQTLVDAFEASITLLRLNTKAWVVNDALTENIDYVSANSNNVTAKDNNLVWTLRMDTPKVFIDGIEQQNANIEDLQDKNFELRYSMTYQVKLDSTTSGIETFDLTSSQTKLKYYLTALDKDRKEIYVKDDGSTIEIKNDWTDDQLMENVLLTMNFKNPKVKALGADLSFNKVSAYENANKGHDPLSGAEFAAILQDGAENNRTLGTGTSSSAGVVEMKNLPSGQNYTIVETKAADGYDKTSAETMTLAVNWGKVTDVKAGDKAITDGSNATLTNKKLPDNTGAFTVTKIWNDGGDDRPTEITIGLNQYKGETLVKENFKTQTLNSKNAVENKAFQWTYTFTDLPVKDVADDQLYTYKAVETNVPQNYTVEYTDGTHTITNNSTSADNKQTIKGTKTWIDAEDDTDVVHPTVTMKLMKPGQNGGQVEVDSVELENGTTEYEFVDVLVYEYGQEIQYTVVEVVGDKYDDNYTAESVDNDFTNRIKQDEKGDIPVTVTWVDGGNAMESRPEGVTLALYADGTKMDEAILSSPEKDGTNTWNYSFTLQDGKPFPVYQVDANDKVTGEKIVYTVTQGSITPAGDKVGQNDSYATETNENNPLNVINTLKGKTTHLGDKTWLVPEGIEKPTISFKLMKGDQEVETVTLSADNTFTFTAVDKYDANGALITYSVQEVIGTMDNGSFAQTSVQDADGTWHFTNTYSEKKTIHVNKQWVDGNNALTTRPTSIQVQLLADGEPSGEPVTLKAENSWAADFTNLEKYKYVEVEVETPAPEPTTPPADESQSDTTTPPTEDSKNEPTTPPVEDSKDEPATPPTEDSKDESATPPAEGDKNEPATPPTEDSKDESATPPVEGDKNDAPLAEDSKSDSEGSSETTVSATHNTGATLDETTDPEPTTPTPQTETIATLIVYTIEEVKDESLSGKGWEYVSAITPDSEESFTITNTLTGTETITVSGTKTWEDANNAYDTRPASEEVTFQLYRNDNKDPLATTTLKDDGSYEFTNLKRFDENGAEYQYTVQEVAVSGYTSTQNGYNFTNTLNQRLTSLSVKKVWVDGNLDKHPDVKFYLYCNNELVNDETNPYTLKSSDGVDAFTFYDLPEFKMENGKVVGKNVYTIQEGPANTNEPGTIEGYQAPDINYDGSPIIVTNKLIGIDSKNEFSFTKMWLAPDDYPLPLDKTFFTIKRNGDFFKTISGADMTLDTETGLYVYKEELPNYSEDGNTPYNYTVEETTVPDGFTLSTPTENIYNFVNTINPGVVELKGQKTWKLPEGMTRTDYGITVEVYRDKVLMGTKDIASASEQDFVFTITDVTNAKGEVVPLPQYSSAGDAYVYTMKEVKVPAGYTSTFTVDETKGTLFTNSIQEVPYQVIAHYTATVDGKTVVDNKQVPLVDDKRFGEDLTVTFAPENHLIDGDYTYTYQSATLEQSDKTTDLTGNHATLTTSGDKHIIHLYFTYTHNEDPTVPTVQHNMTVNYYNYAGRNSDNPTKVMASHNESMENGLPYNVSAWSAIPLAGYQLVEVSGDAIAGVMTSDKTVNVWYTSTDTGTSGGGGGFGGPDETTPPTTGGSTTPPTTEIVDPETPLADRPLTELPLIKLPVGIPPVIDLPDEDVPLAEIPDEDVPLAEIPDEDVPLAEIPDEDVPLAEIPDEDVPLAEIPDEDVPLTDIPDGNIPLGNTPKTGDESAIGLWITLMVLSGLGLSALAIFGKGKRETDADNK